MEDKKSHFSLFVSPSLVIDPANVSAIVRHPAYRDLVACVQNLEYSDKLWGLLGGGVKSGESLFKALRRECAEEGKFGTGRIWINKAFFLMKKERANHWGEGKTHHHSFWNVTDWCWREEPDSILNKELLHSLEFDPHISQPSWISIYDILSGEKPFNPQHLPALFEVFNIDPFKNEKAAELLSVA